MVSAVNFRRTSELLDSHYRIHLGCYFNSIAIEGKAILAKSTIAGGIWNHRWIRSNDGVDLEDAFAHTEFAHVYVELETSPDDSRYEIFDREAWMLLDSARHNRRGTLVGIEILEAQSLHEFEILFELVRGSFTPSHAGAIASSRLLESMVLRRYYLLKIGNEAVGAFSIHHLGKWSAVHDICVRPDQRGRGIGTSLLKAVESRIPENRIAYLACEDNNLVRFYANEGWKVIHKRIGVRRPSVTSQQ
jgi:GNAT superfamily N-acetyltransferase